MTAGQRNCCEAIEQCLDCYGWDDVLFAVKELKSKRPSDKGVYYKQYDVIHACGHCGVILSPPELQEKFVSHAETMYCRDCKSYYGRYLPQETDS